MTFRDVAVKNFKLHARRYLSYFLCNSFSIMAFFIYSSLLFSDDFAKALEGDVKLRLFLSNSNISLLAFSIFFIGYTHMTFIRSRKKEFGLFSTLGMSSNEIARIIAIENSLIGIASLILGLVCGTAVTPVLFRLLMGMLDIEGISFTYSFLSYLLTIIVFALIFAALILISVFITRRMEIIRLLKDDRKAEGGKPSHALQGVAGIAMIAVSLKVLPGLTSYYKLNLAYFFIIFCFTGFYLFISHMGTIMLYLTKGFKPLYYRSILFISEVNYKFTQNKIIISIIGIISTVTIFYVTTACTTYLYSVKFAEKWSPQHLEFVELPDSKKLPDVKLDAILNSGSTPVTGHKTIEFIPLSAPYMYNDGRQAVVTSVEQYNKALNKSLSLENGRVVCLYFSVMSKETNESARNGCRPLILKSNEYSPNKQTYEFNLEESVFDEVKSSFDFYIISNYDYHKIKENEGALNVGRLHIINFKDWYKTGDIVSRFEVAMKEYQNREPVVDLKFENSKPPYTVYSRIRIYKWVKQEGGILLFLMSFIGILFFISSGSIILLKLYKDLDSVRDRYRKLQKIGIREKEMKRILRKELILIFFIPLALGMIMGSVLINLVSNTDVYLKGAINNAPYVLAAYLVFQTVFYLVARRKYINIVLGIESRQSKSNHHARECY